MKLYTINVKNLLKAMPLFGAVLFLQACGSQSVPSTTTVSNPTPTVTVVATPDPSKQNPTVVYSGLPVPSVTVTVTPSASPSPTPTASTTASTVTTTTTPVSDAGTSLTQPTSDFKDRINWIDFEVQSNGSYRHLCATYYSVQNLDLKEGIDSGWLANTIKMCSYKTSIGPRYARINNLMLTNSTCPATGTWTKIDINLNGKWKDGTWNTYSLDSGWPGTEQPRFLCVQKAVLDNVYGLVDFMAVADTKCPSGYDIVPGNTVSSNINENLGFDIWKFHGVPPKVFCAKWSY